MSVSRHFLLQAPQCPRSVRKRFSRDHCCRGRSKPGCRIVGSHIQRIAESKRKKRLHFLADLWSQSEFRTQRKFQRKTDPTSEMTLCTVSSCFFMIRSDKEKRRVISDTTGDAHVDGYGCSRRSR